MRLPQLLFVLCISALCSCSSWHIEKRHYRNGFYFNRGNASGTGHAESKSINDSSLVSNIHQLHSNISEAERDTSEPELKPETNSSVTGTNNAYEDYHEEISADDPKPSDAKSPEEDPAERQIKKTKVLGVLALILVIIGLAGLEVTAFTLPLLLIGIGCAIFGLKIGSMALRNTKSKTRDKDGNKVPDPKHIRAKRAYWLSLAAILLVAAYILIRVVIAGGMNTIVIAAALFGLALLAFLLFKMGVFADLGDE